jgi:hypothetical protein
MGTVGGGFEWEPRGDRRWSLAPNSWSIQHQMFRCASLPDLQEIVPGLAGEFEWLAGAPR